MRAHTCFGSGLAYMSGSQDSRMPDRVSVRPGVYLENSFSVAAGLVHRLRRTALPNTRVKPTAFVLCSRIRACSRRGLRAFRWADQDYYRSDVGIAAAGTSNS